MDRSHAFILLRMFAGIAVVGAMVAAVVWSSNSNAGWTCQTEQAASTDYRGLRKCYRMAEYCEGECEPKDDAHCYEFGTVSRYGPDRNCFVTADDCETGRTHDPEARGQCEVSPR